MFRRNLSVKQFGAASLLLVGLSANANAELLTNPSFEDGFTGYSTFGPGFRFGGGGDANTGAQGLVNDVLITDGAANLRGVLQSVAATPGDGYTFSAFIRGVSLDNTSAFLELKFLDVGNAQIGNAVQTPMISIDQGFTIATIPEQIAPAGTATVQVAGLVLTDLGGDLGDADFVIFDDFSLTARVVPEPASFALVGVGLMGLTTRRRN